MITYKYGKKEEEGVFLLDNRDSNFKFTDHEQCTAFIDIVEKTGKPLTRVDLSQVLSKHGVEIQFIHKIKFPRLQWSNRKIEEYDLTKINILKKAIVTG